VTEPGSLVLLLTSPRVAPGLLTRAAWQVLEAADLVCCAEAADPQPQAVADAGLAVHPFPPPEAPEGTGTSGRNRPVSGAGVAWLARELVRRAGTERVVWIGSPDGDPGLTDALAAELSRVAATQDPPEVEVLVGSQDVPGARLLDVVAVMDRLRSPGGCPWDAAQTHQSLVPYLLEEAHEAAEALEAGDRSAAREELGDVLLQVVFHARVAAEHERAPFDVDDVAADLVAKLVRRHPHVFDPDHEGVADAAAVQVGWDAIKAAEKDRASVLDGIPAALPALARADKVVGRMERAGLAGAASASVGDALADDLLALVRRAREQGRDAEAVLRSGVRALEERARAAEGAGRVNAQGADETVAAAGPDEERRR
jgi:XTP/dITP diphosphohydrolase